MKNLFIIQSCNHKTELLYLIKYLDKHNQDVIIFDNCSDFLLNMNIFNRFESKKGIEKYDFILKWLKHTDYTNYFFINDTFKPNNNFIIRSLGLINSINTSIKYIELSENEDFEFLCNKKMITFLSEKGITTLKNHAPHILI